MILTQQKHAPWRWVFLVISPWFATMFVEMASGAVLTLSLRKFLENPAGITFILSLNVLFNVLIGAVCLYSSDRIWTRFGRRTPFLIVGWALLVVSFLFAPIVDAPILFIVIVILWLASQDISATYEPLQQEIIPPHQRGRAGAYFNVIIQLVVIFTFVVVVGRFHEVQFFDGLYLSGEHGAYWLAAIFLVATGTFVLFFIREVPTKNSLVHEKITPVSFFKDVFTEKDLWPVYLLVFAQVFITTQLGAVQTLLFVDQWDYTPQQMGTNMFVGALLTIIVSIIVGFLADKFDRIKLYIFGMSGALLMKAIFYVFVQFFLPDRHPTLFQIIAFGQMVAVFGMIASVVTQPLMYDYIPRNKMGTATAGISIVRSITRWITLNGVGVWVVVYSYFFMPEGEYDYFSAYLYMIALALIGLVIIFRFQALVKKGVLIPYGRMGVEDDAPSTEDAGPDESAEQNA